MESTHGAAETQKTDFILPLVGFALSPFNRSMIACSSAHHEIVYHYRKLHLVKGALTEL